MLLAYDEESLTVAQHNKIDYLLSLVVQNREGKREELQQQLLERATEVFAKIRTDMEKFNEYGMRMGIEIVDKQLDFLRENKTLAQVVRKHYRTGDAECLEVLKLDCGAEDSFYFDNYWHTSQPSNNNFSIQGKHKFYNNGSLDVYGEPRGNYGLYKFRDNDNTWNLRRQQTLESCQAEKRRRMKEFEIAVLRKGLDEYFGLLAEACEVLFACMDNAINELLQGDNVEMVKKMVADLSAASKTGSHQMMEADKAQLQNRVNAGEYTPDIQTPAQGGEDM